MSFQHNPARYIPPPSSGPSTRSPSPTACAPGHTAARMQARPASHGSRTQVITADEAPEQGAGSGADDVVGVLKLRGARVGTGRKVKWVNGVVDNEGMGRKKSKSGCGGSTRAREGTLTAVLYSLLYLPQTPRVRRVLFVLLFVFFRV